MAKVCIVSTAHSTYDTRIFEKQASSLSKAGHQVHFLTPHEKKEVVNDIQIIPLKKPETRIYRFFLSIYVLYHLFPSDYDIFHIHDPDLLFSGVILEFLSEGSVIFDVHEDYRLTLQNRLWIYSPLRPILAKVYSKVEPIFVRQLSGVILAADDLRQHYKYHPKVETVGNYPQLKWTKKPAPSPECDLRLVFIGGISSQKPLIPFINAVSQTPEKYDIEMDICGSISDKHIEDLIQSYCSSDQNIRYHGWIPHKDAIEICAHSDLGIVSLKKEFLNGINAAYRSRKLFEYMATKTGVLVPNFGNWPDIVDSNEVGVALDVNDPQKIGKEIRFLCEDEDKLEEYKHNSREIVTQKYHWGSEANKLLKFYNTLIGDQRSR